MFRYRTLLSSSASPNTKCNKATSGWNLLGHFPRGSLDHLCSLGSLLSTRTCSELGSSVMFNLCLGRNRYALDYRSFASWHLMV